MKTLLNVVVALCLIAVVGCSGPESYGNAMQEMNVTGVAAILMKPGDYDGKTVQVQGEIVTECPSGCWFEIKEGAALLYVDIAPSGLAIPQRVGKDATVEGVVKVDGQRVMLVGKGLEVE